MADIDELEWALDNTAGAWAEVVAQRDARIRELEARLAVPEGELERDLTTVRRWIYEGAMPQSSAEALDAVVRAAEAWSRLQLHTEPAPRVTRILWVFEGELGPNGDYCTDHEPIGWLPLDALPPVPPTPGVSDG